MKNHRSCPDVLEKLNSKIGLRQKKG